MDKPTLFSHYLSHFHHVSEQRMKMIGYYVAVSAAAVGATIQFLHQAEPDTNPILLIIVSAAHLPISICFAFLDLRARKLVDLAKEALIHLEKGIQPLELRIFTLDDYRQIQKHLHVSGGVLGSIRGIYLIVCSTHFVLGLLFVAMALETIRKAT